MDRHAPLPHLSGSLSLLSRSLLPSSHSSLLQILYEDIVMNSPEQWPIWIGPAQQSDSPNLCAAHPCSLCWPFVPLTRCHAVTKGTLHNLTFRRVTINNPKYSPGVLIAPSDNPATRITFDSVVVNNPASGWGVHQRNYFRCESFKGVATGTTSPVPPCFKDLTSLYS